MSIPPTRGDLPSLQERFPALAGRSFRLWMVGRCFWTLGMVVQTTTVSFLAYGLTRSPAFLGSVSFAFGLPIVILTMFGGLLADRFNRRRLVAGLQALWLIPSVLLSVLTLSGIIEPWHVMALSLLRGVIYALDNPARAAYMPDLVERDDVSQASMLYMAAHYIMLPIASATAGFVYAGAGPGWCFVLSTLLLALPPIAVALTRPAAKAAARLTASALRQLGEGVAYALQHPVERTLLLILALTNMLGLGVQVLFPAWAVNVLQGDAATNGLLNSAVGVGTMLSAIALALLARFRHKGMLLTLVTFIAPAGWLLFAQITWLPAAASLLVLLGAVSFPMISLPMVLLQLLVPDALRGRMMGIFNLASAGSQSLGGLLVGIAAQGMGEAQSMSVAAVLLGLTALSIYVLVPRLRSLE